MTKYAHVRDIVTQYRSQMESGELSKRGLARLLVENGMFATVEQARTAVRHATGSNGDYATKAYEFKSDIATGLKAVQSYATPKEPFILPEGQWGILSDVHVPYHHEEATVAAIEWLVEQGYENLILNGDMIDCHTISRHEKDLGSRSFWQEVEEVEALKAFLRFLRDNFKGQIVYKLGNHETRLERYLKSQAAELAELPQLQLAYLAEFESLDIQEVGPMQIIKAGKLNVIHGHEFQGTGGVTPARGLFNKAKCSTLMGHVHQTSEHHEGTLNGDAMACWTTGCLCDLSPNYSPFAFTRWNHGFATLDLKEDGSFKVSNKRIISGEVY